jgi:hypothetical protein
MRKIFTALAALLLVVGCGDDGNGGGGDLTEVRGVMSSPTSGNGGTMEYSVESSSLLRAAPALTVAAARAPVPASGTIQYGGATVNVTGTYDPDTGELVLEGGGYAFAGLYDGTTLSGTWAGPGDAGTFVSVPGDDTQAYCGTFITDDEEVSGSFSFVLVGGDAVGNEIQGQAAGGGATIPLEGAITGEQGTTSLISFFIPGTTQPFATGQIDGEGVTTGSFVLPGEGSGTWTGSDDQCPA